MFPLVIIGLVVLALVALVTLYRKKDMTIATGKLVEPSDRELVIKDKKEMIGKELEAQVREDRSKALAPVKKSAPELYLPPDEETLGVTRRMFLNRSITGAFSMSLAIFGGGVLKTLYPSSASGFGDKISVGKVEDIVSKIRENGGFFYFPLGRMWITEYPQSAIAKAQSSYTFFSQVEPGLQSGVVALYQTCPHLGCRVPECRTSQWFECPCHGSQYNRVGEKKGGPAPRGMDRFPMEVSASGELSVDTGTIIQGPPIGVNTTGQEAEGPNCLTAGGADH